MDPDVIDSIQFNPVWMSVKCKNERRTGQKRQQQEKVGFEKN